MSYAMQEQAQTAARIESYYAEMSKAYSMRTNDDEAFQYNIKTPDGEKTYTVLDSGTFYRSTEKGDCSVKAMVIKDEKGNVFVHFNGTGDGNWEYNADNAYGTKNVSQQHQWAVNYLDHVMKDNPDVNVYVSGHSQGGNLAQYASMATNHADRVKNCISLDGPNMSDVEVDYLKQTLGEGEFEKRVDKLYAYNGNSDFVSVLGQNRIIRDDHTFIVTTNDIGYNTDGNGSNIGNLFHAANYMLWDDGTFGEIKPYQPDGSAESSFRNFVRNLIEHVKDLPPDEQNKAGHITMKLIENTIGNAKNGIYTDFTNEELDYLKQRLIPMIIKTIEEDPELAKKAIQEALARSKVDPMVIEVVTSVVDGFNDLSPERKQELLDIIAQIVTIKDNKIDVDITNILGHGDLPKIVFDALLLLFETAKNNPELIPKIMAPYIATITELITLHPLETVALVIVGVLAMPLITVVLKAVGVIAIVTFAIDILGGVFPLVGELFRDIASFVVNKVIPALKKFIEWLKDKFNQGKAYVQNNPELMIDTGKFRELAGRVASVNSRLWELDGELNSLYCQVGFLDILSLLHADLLVRWSPTLMCVKNYLSDAAEAFDSADSQVQSMFS